MKRVKFLLAFFAAVTLLASCATTQGGFGDDADESAARRYGNRVYVDDPYYGTVVLERDPFTGRYYDVTNGPAGYRYGVPYGNSWNYRNPRVYRNNARPYGTYNRGNSSLQQKPQPLPQQRPEARNEARKKILGN